MLSQKIQDRMYQILCLGNTFQGFTASEVLENYNDRSLQLFKCVTNDHLCVPHKNFLAITCLLAQTALKLISLACPLKDEIGLQQKQCPAIKARLFENIAGWWKNAIILKQCQCINIIIVLKWCQCMNIVTGTKLTTLYQQWRDIVKK